LKQVNIIQTLNNIAFMMPIIEWKNIEHIKKQKSVTQNISVNRTI
jgi:hypothetical protein